MAVLQQELVLEVYDLLLHLDPLICRILRELHGFLDRAQRKRSQQYALPEWLELALLKALFVVGNRRGVAFQVQIVAEAMNVLSLVVVLLWVAVLKQELEEFDLLNQLRLRQTLLGRLENVDRVILGIEERNFGELFEEDDVVLILDQLSVVFELVVEGVHVAEVCHRLVKCLVRLEGQDFDNRAFPVAAVSQNSVVEAPNLQMQCKFDFTLRVDLQGFHLEGALFGSIQLHLHLLLPELFPVLKWDVLGHVRRN